MASKSNRQHAIEIATKAISSDHGYDHVGCESFFGDPITAAEVEAGLRRECVNLIALIDMTDAEYDARSEANNA